MRHSKLAFLHCCGLLTVFNMIASDSLESQSHRKSSSTTSVKSTTQGSSLAYYEAHRIPPLGQYIHPAKHFIAANNPDQAIIQTQIQILREEYLKIRTVKPVYLGTFQLESKNLTALFPKHRFYVMTWSEAANTKEHVYGLALNLMRTVVIGPDPELRLPSKDKVWPLDEEGGWEDFGQLLAANRIRIGSCQAARRVWNAACDAHAAEPDYYKGRLWQTSRFSWDLGVTIRGDERTAYRINLSSQGIVRKGKFYGVRVK